MRRGQMDCIVHKRYKFCSIFSRELVEKLNARPPSSSSWRERLQRLRPSCKTAAAAPAPEEAPQRAAEEDDTNNSVAAADNQVITEQHVW